MRSFALMSRASRAHTVSLVQTAVWIGRAKGGDTPVGLVHGGAAPPAWGCAHPSSAVRAGVLSPGPTPPGAVLPPDRR